MTEERLKAAASWRLRRRDDDSPAARAAYDAWVEDPANAAAGLDAPELALLRARTRRRVARRRLVFRALAVAAGLVLSLGLALQVASLGRFYDNPSTAPETVLLAAAIAHPHLSSGVEGLS
jgi:ferric-dicitrate binding protein FerR (iron transport regulator)